MLKLPAQFTPTHQTAGLPGYPAIDIFGPAGTGVKAPTAGKIRRLSGKDPKLGGTPGGPYGWSIYLAADNGDDYFLTHFGSRLVELGQRVTSETVLGSICDSKVSGKPNTSHIHEGCKRKARRPKGPSERLYRIVGPKGNPIARGKTAKQIGTAIPRLVRRFGSIGIRPDEQE